MPGVPTGRGCDACRKVKKKCDQGQPSCARCIRLRIDCIGSGQQRFKFKDETSLVSRSASRSQSASPPIAKSPVNNSDLLIKSFVSTITVADMRYSPACYGAFLSDVPRRVGVNPALDAAAEAMTATHMTLYTREKSRDMYSKYGLALNKLRSSMADPKLAEEPETLCAIYMLSIIETWLGNSNRINYHCQAVSHILKMTNDSGKDWMSNPFEKEMTLTLCLTVIFESLSNPKIALGDWFWNLMQQCEKVQQQSPDALISLSVTSVANFTHYVREPENYMLDIIKSYQELQADGPKIQYLIALESGGKKRDLQAAYGVLVTLLIILNRYQTLVDPSRQDLFNEWSTYYKEMTQIAHEMQPYRPLGASFVPLCLVANWATCLDPVQRAETKALIEDYQTDFESIKLGEMIGWVQTRFDNFSMKLAMDPLLHFNLMQQVSPPDPTNFPVDTAYMGSTETL